MLVAFLYASVGHGGASGYLALMAFYAFAPDTMRPTALILNIFVSGISFIQFYRGGYFKWSLFWPFALTSVPAAFFGGLINVDADLYKKTLGVLLLFPIIRLVGLNFKTEESIKEQKLLPSLYIGLIIGIFSGMIGIGGGIILSPVILLLNWANMKQTAAVSALFIFVNSLSGLGGLITNGFHFQTEMLYLAIVAAIGGLVGAYLGAKMIDSLYLRRILAFVLLIAAVKLFTT